MNPRSLMRTCACAFALFVAPAAQAQFPASGITTVPGVVARELSFRGALQNPRGLEVVQTGRVWIAEGGTGGTGSTAGRCAQVMPPIGPYTGSSTGGRISSVYWELGMPVPFRQTLTTNLPTSQTSVESGSLVSGVADIAVMDNVLYALIAGGGCSHGLVGRDNAIVRVSPTGIVSLVANLSAWLRNNPGRVLGPDFEPDGTWYSMVAYNGALYAVEPNHGLFVRVDPATGAISRVLDVSAALGMHAVPTVVARHEGYFYIANLGTFPIVNGSQRVWRVLSNPTRLQAVARGTAIVGLAFDSVNDAMYILQLTTGAPGPTAGRGSIVRIRPGGAPQTIARGLSFPTGMTITPGGTLYVTDGGFGGVRGRILFFTGLR